MAQFNYEFQFFVCLGNLTGVEVFCHLLVLLHLLCFDLIMIIKKTKTKRKHNKIKQKIKMRSTCLSPPPPSPTAAAADDVQAEDGEEEHLVMIMLEIM